MDDKKTEKNTTMPMIRKVALAFFTHPTDDKESHLEEGASPLFCQAKAAHNWTKSKDTDTLGNN